MSLTNHSANTVIQLSIHNEASTAKETAKAIINYEGCAQSTRDFLSRMIGAIDTEWSERSGSYQEVGRLTSAMKQFNEHYIAQLSRLGTDGMSSTSESHGPP